MDENMTLIELEFKRLERERDWAALKFYMIAFTITTSILAIVLITCGIK